MSLEQVKNTTFVGVGLKIIFSKKKSGIKMGESLFFAVSTKPMFFFQLFIQKSEPINKSILVFSFRDTWCLPKKLF